MNIQETLKNFKNISPNPVYSEKSKRMIFATLPREPWTLRRSVAHLFEAGFAVALAAFFIFIFAGQFSNVPYVAPAQFSVINPATLRAEAQAVDIQIKLASVAYTTPTSTVAISETTPQAGIGAGSGIQSGLTAAALHATGVSKVTTSSDVVAGTQENPAATSSASVSVDEALKALSE